MLDSAREEEEDSQDAPAGPSSADRIPFGPLKAVIESFADRVNYGLDVSDLPKGSVPEGVSDVPVGLQVWRWEVRDEGMLPREVSARLEKRKVERKQVSLAEG